MLALTADCLPIARRAHRRPAARSRSLHAGWRGLAEGVVAAGVAALGGREGGRASARRSGRAATRSGRRSRSASTPTSRATASSTSGPPPSARCAARASRAVDRVDLCTRCHPELFFSHRRDGARARRAGSDRCCRRLRSASATSACSGRSARASRSSRRRSTSRSPTWRSLAEAGVEVVGENRAQDLEAKHAEYGDAFRWHFIGRLQSNKVKVVNRICELVHSLDSRLGGAAARGARARAGQPRRRGRRRAASTPAEIGELPRATTSRGLSTMPPAAADARGVAAVVRAAARARRASTACSELSMGTTQDYRVAAEEGATYVRVGLDPVSRSSIPATWARRSLEPHARLLRDRRGGRGLGRRRDGYAAEESPRAELPRAAERPPADPAPPRPGLRRLDGVRGRPAGAARRRRARPARAARPRAAADRGRAEPELGARAPRPAAQLQRRAADRRQVQAVDPGDPQPPERRHRALEAADRLRERPHLRAERRHAARRRQGVPAHAAKRRGVAPSSAPQLLERGGFFNQA